MRLEWWAQDEAKEEAKKSKDETEEEIEIVQPLSANQESVLVSFSSERDLNEAEEEIKRRRPRWIQDYVTPLS